MCSVCVTHVTKHVVINITNLFTEFSVIYRVFKTFFRGGDNSNFGIVFTFNYFLRLIQMLIRNGLHAFRLRISFSNSYLEVIECFLFKRQTSHFSVVMAIMSYIR